VGVDVEVLCGCSIVLELLCKTVVFKKKGRERVNLR
jgi:hypothetical protein